MSDLWRAVEPDDCEVDELLVPAGVPVNLSADGLLWLINRQVLGDGSEPWVYGGDGSGESSYLERVKELLR